MSLDVISYSLAKRKATISDVEGYLKLVGALNKKYDSDIDSILDIAAVPDLTRSKITDFFNSPFWDNIPDKPSTFPPDPHTHVREDITDFFNAPFWDNIPDKPSPLPSDEELVLCLPFNEGYGSMVHDISGNGNNGTIYGATWVRGRYGYALSFDGSNDYVNVPHSDSLNTESGTVAAWVNIQRLSSEFGDYQAIVHKAGQWWFRIDPDDRFVLYLHVAGSWAGGAESSTVAEKNAWYFVVGTWEYDAVNDVTTWRIYVNGQLEGEQQAAGKIDFATNPVGIARPGYLQGIIDEVRIYARALTEEEIKALYYSSQSVRREYVTSVMKVLDSDILLTADNTYDIGSPSLRWANIYAVNVYTGDLCFEEKVCDVCGRSFEEGDEIVLKVKKVDDYTRTVPIHVKCSQAYKELDERLRKLEEVM